MTTKKNLKHDPNRMLLHANLKQLRLPTMKAEFEKLAREASAANQTFEQYLLQLTELEVTARASNALSTRIRNAHFPVEKDLESYDFSAIPSVSKQKFFEPLIQTLHRTSTVHFSGAEAPSKPPRAAGDGSLRMDSRAWQCLPAGTTGHRVAWRHDSRLIAA